MNEDKIRRMFEKDLTRVKDAIVAASEHYNIDYIYTNDRDRKKYVNVLNRYRGFFRASMSAQFTAMLLTLLEVLDQNTKNNRISMYSLVESAQKHGLVESSQLQTIRGELNKTDEMFRKLQLLRNNVFAHLGTLDSKEAFKRAGISSKDLKKLIGVSMDILKSIYYAYNRGDFAFDYGAKNDTYALLNGLSKIHKC